MSTSSGNASNPTPPIRSLSHQSSPATPPTNDNDDNNNPADLGASTFYTPAKGDKASKSRLQAIVQKQNDLKPALEQLAVSGDKQKDEEELKRWNELVMEKDRLLKAQLAKDVKADQKCSIM